LASLGGLFLDCDELFGWIWSWAAGKAGVKLLDLYWFLSYTRSKLFFYLIKTL